MESVDRPPNIAIARIARTQGNKGEVLAELHTDFPERFENLRRLWLAFPDGRRESVLLEHSWDHKGRKVLKFEGTSTISEAEALVGAWVEIEADQAVPLPEGHYFDHELVGCTVQDIEGKDLGTVTDVMRITGNHLLVVQGDGGEVLVPATDPICRKVLVKQRRIIVELPDGLLDLNK